MVARQKENKQVLERVTKVYDWLDGQIRKSADLAGQCNTCGKCCNFDSPAPASEQGFDHRLFVTTPELMYLAAKLGAENIKTMAERRCPYNVDGKCTIYENRFAGCRIFCCNGNTDFQSELSEQAIKKIKSICEEFRIPYRYNDLQTALKSL